MTTAEVRRRIGAAVERIGSIKAAAEAWGVHPSMVGAAMRGEKAPGRKIAEALRLPQSGSRRGGPPDRGRMPGGRVRPKAEREPRPRPERKPSVGPPIERPEPPTTGEERAAIARRAAEIRLAGMPGPYRGDRPPRGPSWRRVVRVHLRIERRLGIQG
jgi:hypothetical protein